MKKCTSFEGQKGTRYIWGNVYFGIIVFTCLSSTKACLRFFLNLFYSEDERLLSEFFRKWGWFQGHNECFPQYLGWTLTIQKTKTRFCRWKSTDNNDTNIFLSLENPCTLLLVKEKTWKRIFDTNSELSQNRTEKQIMAPKTTINWLFNLCFNLFNSYLIYTLIMLFIHFVCFNSKTGVFQTSSCKGLYP